MIRYDLACAFSFDGMSARALTKKYTEGRLRENEPERKIIVYHYRTLVVLVLFLAAFLAERAQAAPLASVPVAEHDFGRLKEGGEAFHLFTIKNDGDEPLVIKRIKTSCGCTASSTTRDTIAPGETGEIKVIYKTRNRPGPFHQKVLVLTNDPAQAETMLTIRGEVEQAPAPRIDLVEKRVDLGVVSVRHPAPVAITVRNAGVEELVVNSIGDYRGGVLLSQPETIDPGKEKRLDLLYTPPRAGMINETLTIMSNDPRRVRFPVFLVGYAEEKETVIVSKGDDQQYTIFNDTAAPVRASAGTGKGNAVSIDPGKRVVLELPAGKDPENITILFGQE